MPRSKTRRKSKSGESRKTNRLKNGNDRYRPGMGRIPGAPTNFMEYPGTGALTSIFPESRTARALDRPEETP